jgi:TetR/AcrR family transcriptional regulator, acrAB operon repressor
VSPQTTARGLHALVDGLIANWMLDPRAFDLCRVGRSAVRQMLRGLAARA